ncbi:uncharacterized protein IWZ02DRAFT_451153 [Phyllosticta citriasiana]|uniref:Secreted protein n=1 Tax=Phyllosticta citriasiana TaxID=595635 RepID=A0ABR1KS33_9PEZI
MIYAVRPAACLWLSACRSVPISWLAASVVPGNGWVVRWQQRNRRTNKRLLTSWCPALPAAVHRSAWKREPSQLSSCAREVGRWVRHLLVTRLPVDSASDCWCRRRFGVVGWWWLCFSFGFSLLRLAAALSHSVHSVCLTCGPREGEGLTG